MKNLDRKEFQAFLSEKFSRSPATGLKYAGDGFIGQNTGILPQNCMEIHDAVCVAEGGDTFEGIGVRHENDPRIPRQPCEFFRQPENIRDDCFDFLPVQRIEKFLREIFLVGKHSVTDCIGDHGSEDQRADSVFRNAGEPVR